MAVPPRFTWRARLGSFVYAARGLRWLVREEHNARLHAIATIAVAAAGVWLRLPIGEWRWIALATAMVWMAEAFNTAIEDLCDRICPKYDPVIGRIKDLAAAGVLLASVAAALIGAMTLGPPLLARFD